ncbi:MAG: hypothetical protein QOH29_1123 [Actinomycetota bacterium]|nr:hypothetical protein [Actinomycetota bacterium]
MSSDSLVELSFFGSRVAVETHDPELGSLVRRLWEPFLADGADDAALSTSGIATSTFIEIPDADEPLPNRLGWLNSTLNSTAMELSPCLCIHAGVVACDEGVVAFPGRSGAGKSTLTSACLQRGFDYVSDEGLCLDYDLATVRPYPRPIGLSPWSVAAMGGGGVEAGDDLLMSAADLGSRATLPEAPHLRVAHVVLIDRRPDVQAVLHEVERREAIETLLTMSFNHYKRPADALALVAGVVAAARVSRLTYGDPHEAAGLLAAAVSDPTARRRSP